MKVLLVAAVTTDGFIARNSREFPDWTSKEDKRSFAQLTKDAVLVFGGHTIRAIGRALPNRRNIVYTRGDLNIAGTEITNESPKDLIERLEHEGHNKVVICGGSTIYSLFLDAGVVDELYLTIAPHLFGQGVSLLSNRTDVPLALRGSKLLNSDTILLHYEVI